MVKFAGDVVARSEMLRFFFPPFFGDFGLSFLSDFTKVDIAD